MITEQIRTAVAQAQDVAPLLSLLDESDDTYQAMETLAFELARAYIKSRPEVDALQPGDPQLLTIVARGHQVDAVIEWVTIRMRAHA